MSDKQINDGGPAFPMGYHPEGNSSDQCGGLTIRDYFAAKAMQGMLATDGALCADVDRPRPSGLVGGETYADARQRKLIQRSEDAVAYADALIAALAARSGAPK